jgi:hypothetical protein
MITFSWDLAKCFIHMVTDSQMMVYYSHSLGHMDYFRCRYTNKLVHQNIRSLPGISYISMIMCLDVTYHFHAHCMGRT